MDELVAEFLSEASEGLQTLDNELVELERNPDNAELLSSIFRIMHTIKGTCGFLNLSKLASVAHAGENIMDKIRNKQMQVTPDIISIILEAIDTIKDIVAYISEHGSEPEDDYAALISKIENAINNSPSTEVTTKAVREAKEHSPSTNQTENNAQEQTSKQNINEPKTTPLPAKTEQPTLKNGDNKNDKTSPIHTIKVNVNILEVLMQIVSELVLNRNQLIQLDRTLRDGRFAAPIQRLNVITSSLQETVMETRMQPIGSAWVKVPRMIRDLSKDLNKKINLVMIGEETELDRQLIESIKDPLVHMIRNAADHGIENPADRIAAGKSEEGTITLNAYHQGGHIILEVSDDGRGLSVKKIKSKIIQNKLATEKEVASMSDSQISQFIFKAGFSTAEAVTEVSGRGVGMDVVKTNIEDIRGAVEFKSIEGKGSTFVMKIPLTLAIMPILVIESSKQKFGLPQVNVIEMVRTGGSSEHVIEEINENKVLRLRDSLLPLITLSELLKTAPDESIKNEHSFIVVCEVNGTQFGLVVDKIYDTEEIVLKPVSKLLKSIDVYSGNTLLGSGEVIMILDAAGITKHLTALTHEETEVAKSLAEQNKQSTSKTSSFLVLKSGPAYKAIPLELVARLEEIDLSKIETVGEKLVIQYRDSLMFLSLLDSKYKLPSSGMQQVVVFGNSGHILGLIVEEILDIIEQDIENNMAFEESDMTAIVLGGKTMDLVDINPFFRQAFPSETSNTIKKLKQKYNILTIDDSPFFRKILASSLEDIGFSVETYKSAQEAIQKLNSSPESVNLIITDINMPQMDGFQFAQFCKANDQLKNIPIIALTSNVELVSDGSDKMEVSGIKHCIAKTNQDELIQSIYSLLNI